MPVIAEHDFALHGEFSQPTGLAQGRLTGDRFATERLGDVEAVINLFAQ
jgi:hypothetical protein